MCHLILKAEVKDRDLAKVPAGLNATQSKMQLITIAGKQLSIIRTKKGSEY